MLGIVPTRLKDAIAVDSTKEAKEDDLTEDIIP